MRSGMVARMVGVIVGTLAAVTAAGPVIYVDAGATGAGTGASWADACNSLQDGLALAAGADKPVEMRIAKGIYRPDRGAGITPGDQAATFTLLNGVTLKGGYAGAGAPDPDARDVILHETLLSGDLAGDDIPVFPATDPGSDRTGRENSRYVVTGSGTDSTAVIDGVTMAGASSVQIAAGSPTILNCRFAHFSLTALWVTDGSHPVVTDCTFVDIMGVAMRNLGSSHSVVTGCRFEDSDMENWDSSPVITGCQFIRSRIDASDSNSVLTDCVFEGGGRRSRGLTCSGGHLTVTGCTFTGFTGEAIRMFGDLTLVRCVFKNNSGFGGVAVHTMFGGRVTALECRFVANTSALGAVLATDMELHDCEFTGNSGSLVGAVSVDSEDGRLVATGCVFSGNSGGQVTGAIRSCAMVTRLSNCTFVDNRGPSSTLAFLPFTVIPPRMTQCIVRDGPKPFDEWPGNPQARVDVRYSNVQGGRPGEGNIDVDPCFVDPGRWDPNGTPDDPNDDIWIAGDYHLKSQGGHWDRATQTWIRDDVTSTCIDAGDPNAPVGIEPFPNGGFVNLGAYGGTAEASKSYFREPVCESQMAGDINGDCVVDQADLDILQLHWLMEGTGLVNTPPTITLVSPKEGDELRNPTPIVLQAAASDREGSVVRVTYAFTFRRTTSAGIIVAVFGAMATDPADNWRTECPWSSIANDGTYTIEAEAMDNEGLRTVTPPITVTLHPTKK